MTWFVAVSVCAGCVLVYFHLVIGVLVLVAGAWGVPLLINDFHQR